MELTYVGTRAMAVYMLPLNEVETFDFYDRRRIPSARLKVHKLPVLQGPLPPDHYV